jgi:flagellar hook-associated protein 1 FlgK
LSSGELAGLIQVRDQKIPTLLSNLDTLAAGLANNLNAANAKGFTLVQQADGTLQPGGNIFVVPPASGQGAASTMAVAITDPSLIAASSDATASASNGNVAVLSAVQNQTIGNAQSPTDYYSNIVFGVGNDVSNGSAELNSSQLILNQLKDQRGSISGVSLDEEAANMVQYQRAFDAAAQMITTVNDMPRSCAEAGVLRRVVPLNDIPAVILQATRYRKRA